MRWTAVGLLAWAAFTSSAPAYAQAGDAPRSAAERVQISDLMHRAVVAARREAEAARANAHLDAWDRRNAQSQFALILMSMRQCRETLEFVDTHGEIMASGIARLIFQARVDRDDACVTDLAGRMVTRFEDSDYTPGGRIGLRFEAAAYLDAAGKPDARAIMEKAEGELLALPDRDALWNARWHAVDAYQEKPGYMGYLEYLADRMLAEHLSPDWLQGRSLLALLAGKGRCDLVEKIVQQGPASCDKPLRTAEGIYIHPRPPTNMDAMIKAFGAEAPPVEEESLRRALDEPTPWRRLTGLMSLVDACQDALGGGAADHL